MTILNVCFFIIPRWSVTPSWFSVFFVAVTVIISLVCVLRQNARRCKADKEKLDWNLRLCELGRKEGALRKEADARRRSGDPSWCALSAEADRVHMEHDKMLFPHLYKN